MNQETIDKLRRLYNESTSALAKEGAKKKLQDAGISLTADEPKMNQETIDKLRRLYNESTSALAKEGAKKKLQDAGVSLSSEEKPKAEPKPKAESKPKAENPKSEPKPKAEKPTTKDDDDYCNELISKEKERKAKAKASAIKRANAPKKTPSTKNKEAISKTSAKVEKSVISRAKKGEVKVAELEKLISEYEDAIKKLKALLSKVKSGKKFAKGGNMGMMDSEHAKEYHDIKEHSCGCSDKKMAKGGNINGKLYLKGFFADIYEDDYENGQGRNVNSISEQVNKSFRSGEELLKYIKSNIIGSNDMHFHIEEDGLLYASLLVDYEMSGASNSQIERWKKGEENLYSADYYFSISMIQEETLSKEKLSEILGVDMYAKGGSIESGKNEIYLSLISSDRKAKILQNVAKHYNISIQEAENEVTDSDAEDIYEYIANDKQLKMSVYSEFESMLKSYYAQKGKDFSKMKRGGGIRARKRNPNARNPEVDKDYSAMKDGKRTSRKYANVEMRGGGVYHRRNANQYGKTKGGNTYYEHHDNRSDKRVYYENGGAIDKKDSLMNFVSNEMSSGMVASKCEYSDYKTCDKIKSKMISILKKDGDRKFSITATNTLVKQAVKELGL